jgi:hypothetical protein
MMMVKRPYTIMSYSVDLFVALQGYTDNDSLSGYSVTPIRILQIVTMMSGTLRGLGRLKMMVRAAKPPEIFLLEKYLSTHYGYSKEHMVAKENVARGTLSQKSSVEVQLEEAMAREMEDGGAGALAESGILLALRQGVGVVSGLKNASLNAMVDIFDENHQRVQ